MDLKKNYDKVCEWQYKNQLQKQQVFILSFTYFILIFVFNLFTGNLLKTPWSSLITNLRILTKVRITLWNYGMINSVDCYCKGLWTTLLNCWYHDFMITALMQPSIVACSLSANGKFRILGVLLIFPLIFPHK